MTSFGKPQENQLVLFYDNEHYDVVTTLPGFFGKEIKNASECIVELYKHAGIFKNTREVHREARGTDECFSHFSSVAMHSDAFFISFTKCYGNRARSNS